MRNIVWKIAARLVILRTCLIADKSAHSLSGKSMKIPLVHCPVAQAIDQRYSQAQQIKLIGFLVRAQARKTNKH